MPEHNDRLSCTADALLGGEKPVLVLSLTGLLTASLLERRPGTVIPYTALFLDDIIDKLGPRSLSCIPLAPWSLGRREPFNTLTER